MYLAPNSANAVLELVYSLGLQGDSCGRSVHALQATDIESLRTQLTSCLGRSSIAREDEIRAPVSEADARPPGRVVLMTATSLTEARDKILANVARETGVPVSEISDPRARGRRAVDARRSRCAMCTIGRGATWRPRSCRRRWRSPGSVNPQASSCWSPSRRA